MTSPNLALPEIVLTLPYPISANRYWISFPLHGRTMTAPSKEAKAYKSEVAWLAKQAGIRKPIAGRVSIDIKLYPKRPQDWAKRAKKDPETWDDTVLCIDLDNANKVLFDAFKGVVIDDDKWVRRLSSERMEPDGDARVIVTVRKLAIDTPQPALFEVQQAYGP